MKDDIDIFIIAGFNALVKESLNDLSSRDLIISIALNNFEIIEENLKKLSMENQFRLISLLNQHNNFSFKTCFWKKYIKDSICEFNKLVIENTFLFSKFSLFYLLLNNIKEKNEKVDWNEVFSNFIIVGNKQDEKIKGFDDVLAKCEDNLIKLVNSSIKKNRVWIKKEIYSKIISEGLLDEKIARRIRSEKSLSQELIELIFENKDRYSSDFFQRLIFQFMDTKNNYVIRYISFNVPIHFIPFLLGVSDKIALNILKDRLNFNNEE